jgi:hypothetical protein
MRFVVARQGNIELAHAAICEWLQWRKELQLDRISLPPDSDLLCSVRGYHFIDDANPDFSIILRDDEELAALQSDEHPMLHPLKIKHYLNWYTSNGGGCFHKCDRHGRPVYVERLGLHDAKGLAKKYIDGLTINYHILGNEFLTNVLIPKCNEVRKQNGDEEVSKMVAVFDCRGMSMQFMHLPALNILQSMAALDQKYFPEILGKLYIVNAPFAFTSIWSIVKRWLDKGVLDKIQVLGTSYVDELTKTIAPEDLPAFLGGECECLHIEGGCCPTPRKLDAVKSLN